MLLRLCHTAGEVHSCIVSRQWLLLQCKLVDKCADHHYKNTLQVQCIVRVHSTQSNCSWAGEWHMQQGPLLCLSTMLTPQSMVHCSAAMC